MSSSPSASLSAPEKTTATGPDVSKRCPYCHWDLQKPFPEEVSQQDRIQYVASLFGQPFSKEYVFLGGRLRLRYRDVETIWISQLAQQLKEDWQAGKPESLGSDYCAALYLDQMQIDKQTYSYHERRVQFFKENGIDLPKWLHTFQQEKPFNQNQVWTLLLQGSRQFLDLLRRLEQQAQSPDFLAETAT